MSLSDDEVRFSVEDDGRGFEAAAAAANGPGLVSMRERAAPIGGQLEIRSELAVRPQGAGSTDWTYAWVMTQPDAPVADLFARTALASWKQNLDRLDGVFAAASDDQLQQEVAPGKNRLFYLLGHLVAVHDRMLPLLRLGARLHPELDEAFLTKADRTAPDTITPASLRAAWTEVNSALTSAMESLPAAAWLERHDAISAEDFDREPLRNRLSVLLSRGGHVQFHTGQIRLIIKQG